MSPPFSRTPNYSLKIEFSTTDHSTSIPQSAPVEMLPKFLVGSYKRYKTDIDTFTTWLAETAKDCVCSTNNNVSIKSKASASSGSSTRSKKHHVPVSRLTKFAEAIAAAHISVPRTVLSAGQRAVSARKKFSKWFKQKMSSNSKDDEAHLHFIKTFEAVLETLVESIPVPQSRVEYCCLRSWKSICGS